jgi:hypothetical protein
VRIMDYSAYYAKTASYRTDYHQRRRDQERLDSYGLALSFDPVKTPEQALLEREEIDCVITALEGLSPRFERVFRLYFGIGCEPHTFREVGEKIGITFERVRQIICNGERKLKSRLWKKLRPEEYRAWSDARLKAFRRMQAREAERAAEFARREAEFLTFTLDVRMERNLQASC